MMPQIGESLENQTKLSHRTVAYLASIDLNVDFITMMLLKDNIQRLITYFCLNLLVW